MGRAVPKCGPQTGSSSLTWSLLETQMLGPTPHVLSQDPCRGLRTCVLKHYLIHSEV